MSAPLMFPVLWAQAFLQGVPSKFRVLIGWLYVLGDPTVMLPPDTTFHLLLGALISWLKVVSLICLFGWTLSWLSAALKEKAVGRIGPLDIAALVALVGIVGTVLLRVLETNKQFPVYKIGGVYTVTLLALLWAAVLFVWVEAALWSTVRKLGRRPDALVLLGVHLGLAIGLAYGFLVRGAYNAAVAGTTQQTLSFAEGLVVGARMSLTYMGYFVLVRVAWHVLTELFAVRFRRLYAIAKLTVIEATRRMWAPWVVIVIFGVVLAFTHWFLQPPRAAEVGRLYVGTLALLCSLLLTVMVTLLTPLSLPHDIQYQTIYTVVSKPVRRLELVWGRMLGFMALVTALIVVFGGISLLYLSRTVGGTIAATEEAAKRALEQNKPTEARQLREQAEQIRTRMAARVPVFGSLTFLDSKGTPHVRGIDVGQEQSMREPRSHIEGATPATAIWTYGFLPDPLSPRGQRLMVDRRIPVDLMIQSGTVEALLDRQKGLEAQLAIAQAEQSAPNLPAGRAGQLTATIARLKDELQKATEAHNQLDAQAKGIEAQADAAEKAGDTSKSRSLRDQAARLHSPRIPIEMTFNIYRTTKGKVGDPVHAEIEVTNPITGQSYQNIFPIREYYTNRQYIPARVLAGAGAAPPGQPQLRIEVRCISPTQYMGMAESDLFLLARSGDFGTNFMKGLFGVWLQAMVLTAIGVFAGTFLSWPVALLTTVAFFVAGQVAFNFLLDFTRQSILGGGPFESLIRILSHDNQMSDLAPTLAVVTAKTLDALVMPVMSGLVYVVPNFSALDVSNTVADGFAVSWTMMGLNLLLALAYALPFSIAGYFILKNREVAA
jgi:ABC-type transport system involved in multi-copper enzyme maturation permease subunit